MKNMRMTHLAATMALLITAPIAGDLLPARTSFGALEAQAKSETEREKERERERERARERRRAEHDDDSRGEYRSQIDTTFNFSRDGVVDLSLVSGEIRVTGWSRGEIKVNASSEHGLLRFDATSSRVAISVRSDRGRLGDTQYELSVPEGVRVITKAVSGDISVTGTKGELEAGSVSGEVVVSDGARRVDASSVSGSVRVERVQGDLRAASVSGDLEVSDVSGEVTTETVSGELTLARIRSRYVRSESVSGNVEFDGSIEANGRYEFNSHSGDVTLQVPDGIGATISVETYSGSIDSDFPITLQPGQELGRGRRFDFTVGNGAARVTAETFSGNIIISKSGGRR
jgi:DUF4097 and DUF4098 domain-containing protein YvlB